MDELMQRVGRWTKLKAETVPEYIRAHQELWPEMKAAIEKSGIRNYSIYLRGCELFSYFEVEDLQAANAFLSTQAVAEKWQQAMAPFMDAADALAPWESMEEVFHLD
jgi:L-rhamnose mutarotase